MPPWGFLQLPVIFGKPNRPFSVLTLSGLSAAFDPDTASCVPRLLWHSPLGFLPVLPLPPASVMKPCLSLSCWSSFEFFPRPSSLLTPHAFSWVISCQISKSPIQISCFLKLLLLFFELELICSVSFRCTAQWFGHTFGYISVQLSFLIFRFINLFILHTHFDIPQVAKMPRVEFLISPWNLLCSLPPWVVVKDPSLPEPSIWVWALALPFPCVASSSRSVSYRMLLNLSLGCFLHFCLPGIDVHSFFPGYRSHLRPWVCLLRHPHLVSAFCRSCLHRHTSDHATSVLKFLW